MKQALFKGQLDRHHLIPLTYWFARYAGRRMTLFVFRLLAIELLSLLSALLVMRLWIIDSLVFFLAYWLLAWVGFTSFYELGYFMNDFWSEARERRRSGGPHAEQSVSGSVLWPAVVIRMGVALAASISIGLFESTSFALLYGGLLVLTGAVFALHNLIYFPMRVVTFVLLYLLKYAICGLFIVYKGSAEELFAYSGLVIPVAFAYGVKYALMRVPEASLSTLKGVRKTLLSSLLKSHESIIPQIAITLLILEVIILAVAGIPFDSLSFTVTGGLLVILRFRRTLHVKLLGGLGRGSS